MTEFPEQCLTGGSQAKQGPAPIGGVLDPRYQAPAHQVVREDTGCRLTDRELAAQLADCAAGIAAHNDQGSELRHGEIKSEPHRHVEFLEAHVYSSHVGNDCLDQRLTARHGPPLSREEVEPGYVLHKGVPPRT